MTYPFIPYTKHHLTEADIKEAVAAMRSPKITQGEYVERFERALSEYLTPEGEPPLHVVVCSSGTAALTLAYDACLLTDEDEVIVPDITFSATASAAWRLTYGKIRVADCNGVTGLIDQVHATDLLRPTTIALTAVHLGGAAADIDTLREICRTSGVVLIDDACHAIGGNYRDGSKIGSGLTDMTVFSFHPAKHIAIGEGGAVVTPHERYANRMRLLRHHGIERDGTPWGYKIDWPGYNFRLSDISAALGVSQLKRLDEQIAHRRRLAQRYVENIADIPFVTPCSEWNLQSSAFHLMQVVIDWQGANRKTVMHRLMDRGIGTQVHYIPLSKVGWLPMVKTGPGAQHFYNRTLSLPMYGTLTLDQVDRVCDELKEALK